jgi:hypothetical protein
MDIKVYIPKKALNHFWADKAAPENTAWWTFRYRPKINVGDYVWFCHDGFLIAGTKVYLVTDESQDCDSGKIWKGWHVKWYGADVVDLIAQDYEMTAPIQGGFAYASEKESELLKKLYNGGLVI